MAPKPKIDFEICPAMPEDASEAVKVMRASIVELCEKDHENNEARLSEWLANKNQETFLTWLADDTLSLITAKHRQKIVAVAAVSHDNAMITLLYVAPAHTHQGISSALLTQCEKLLFEGRAQQIFVESSKTALQFYRARGWAKEEGRTAQTNDATHLTKFKRSG